MAQRTGLPQVRKFAQAVCNLIVRVQPILNRVYSDNPELLQALAGLATACNLFVLEADEVIELGV